METLPLPEVTDLQPIASLVGLKLPVMGTLVKGGFPNPADNFFRDAIDLNDIVIRHPDHTYFGFAWSDSMEPTIPEGAILVVDKKDEVLNGKFVVAEIDGDLCMKRLIKKDGHIELHSENPDYLPIILREGMNINIFGRITHVINIL